MLPSNYTKLKYIQSTGTQFIDTNIVGSLNLKHEIKVNSQYIGESAIFGSAWAFNANFLMFYGNGIRWHSANLVDVSCALNTDYVIKAENGKVNIDGFNFTCNPSTSVSTNKIRLFWTTDNANYNKGQFKLYYYKVWEEENLIADFVPSMRNADGVVGLYDLVNDEFYTNNGTGTFLFEYDIDDLPNNIYLESSSLFVKVSDDLQLEAFFRALWNININYDDTLGSATYEWLEGNNAVLIANPNDNAQFLGWYYESEPVSTDLAYQIEVNHDVTYEARFERIYDVNTSVVGSGAIQFERQTNKNIIVISVIPNANWSFEKYVVDGVEYIQNPLPLQIENDISVVAYFLEDDRYHISVSTNVPNGTVYVSNNDDYVGYEATLWARPIPNYIFNEWDDGNKENPREISVYGNVNYLAKYVKEAEPNGIYQYRCFVKDQLDLTSAPKAFMIVDSFTIRKDLMTNAKSTMTVLSMASNVNNGDVVVLYDPRGNVVYQGVVTSIEDKKISCSQMQSYYKGIWVYNVSPKATLEEEFAALLQDYADGKMYKSTYVDSLVAQRLGGITIDFIGSTLANLPKDLDDKGEEKFTTQDMEKFIYSLYEDYGIILDFEINFSGANYVHIKVPDFDSIKVGNNMYAIQNMSPIETIEETNRLIIYSAKHVYRKTYVATKSGIVEEPTSTANRFDITNTKIVSSDDELSDLVANNLPSVMYNHKLTFDLVLKNFIYQFDEFHLGMPLDVWYGSDYYNSVLTGYEMKKTTNENVTYVSFTCGKVRNSLTQKLTTLGVL